MAGVAPRDDRGPIAPSGPDCTVGPRPRLHRAPIAPSGPDRAPIAPSGPDQGPDCAVTRSFAYKAASSATPAVRMVPGRSARIPGGCGAVGDVARAYLVLLFFPCFFSVVCFSRKTFPQKSVKGHYWGT